MVLNDRNSLNELLINRIKEVDASTRKSRMKRSYIIPKLSFHVHGPIPFVSHLPLTITVDTRSEIYDQYVSKFFLQ